MGGHEVPVELGVLGDHLGDERGVDKAGADGVDADTPVGVVERGAFGQADLGVLGSDIAGVAGHAGQASTRGDVHDRAEALLGHDLQLVLHREEHAAHVGGEHQVEGLHRVADERCESLPQSTPALLTATSTCAGSPAATSTAWRTASSSWTSAMTYVAVPPVSVTSSTVSWRVAAVRPATVTS